jgi:glycyl-tRNA synthetase
MDKAYSPQDIEQRLYRDWEARGYFKPSATGTPYCITVDGQTLADDTVTIRDRDSLRQWRVPAANIDTIVADLISGKLQVPEGETPSGSDT